MVLALVVFGPRRLPEIGRQIGKLLYEFRKASNDFKLQMEEELRVAEENDRLKKQTAIAAATPALTAESGVIPISATTGGETIETAGVGAGEEHTIHSPEDPRFGDGWLIQSTGNLEGLEVHPEAVQAESEQAAAEKAGAAIAAPVVAPPSVGETVSAKRPEFNTNLIAEGERTARDFGAVTKPEVADSAEEAGPRHG